MRKESLDDIVGRWPGDEELSDWFEAGYLALVAALDAAPPDLQTWTFLPAPSPLAMWSRRQAHETAIHRVDTELTAGRPEANLSAFTPDFAADGVDELLTCFVPRRSTGLRSEDVVTLGIRCVDDDAAWVLSIGPDGVTTTAGVGAADCTVRGAAGDLYLALWYSVAAATRLSIEGDRAGAGRGRLRGAGALVLNPQEVLQVRLYTRAHGTNSKVNRCCENAPLAQQMSQENEAPAYTGAARRRGSPGDDRSPPPVSNAGFRSLRALRGTPPRPGHVDMTLARLAAGTSCTARGWCSLCRMFRSS